jgi:hypothetical protein
MSKTTTVKNVLHHLNVSRAQENRTEKAVNTDVIQRNARHVCQPPH